jgi:hypothetical protein
MLFPSIPAAPRREAALDRHERPPQALDTQKRLRQGQCVFLHRLRRFGQAAVWRGPQADQEDPLLDKPRQELGIHLPQDALGFGAARLVDAALTAFGAGGRPHRRRVSATSCGTRTANKRAASRWRSPSATARPTGAVGGVSNRVRSAWRAPVASYTAVCLCSRASQHTWCCSRVATASRLQ